MYCIGEFDRTHTPNRGYETGLTSRHTLHNTRFTSSEEDTRYGYGGLLGKHKRQSRSEKLPDFEEYKQMEDKYYETVKNLGIERRMKHWMAYTKEWIHEGILINIIQ